jgi:hypothetical protein
MVAKRKASRQASRTALSGQQILPASQVPVGSKVTHQGERLRLTAINEGYAMLRDESQMDRLIFVSPDTLLEDIEPYEVRHLSDGKGAK